MQEKVWKIFSKKYAASGPEDMLVEASVFGHKTVIMSSGSNKRCALAHILMYEAL